MPSKAFTLSVCVSALTLCMAWAGENSASKVKVSAAASKIDGSGKQTITLTMKIDQDWHIYANPVKNSTLTAAQTKITVTGKQAPSEVKVLYPAGKQFVDKNSPEIKYMIYENKVDIPIAIQRAEGHTGPLEVSVRFMACDDSNCLFPATVKVTVP